MSEGALELLGILGSFLGAVIGAVGALSFREYLDRRRVRQKEKQTRWLPLLRAAQALTETFDELTSIYLRPRYVWNDHRWTDVDGMEHPLPLEARDFHELYLLDPVAEPIRSFQDLPGDPARSRRESSAIQSVRARIHELNRATTSLYRAAVYLGYAQRVQRELEHARLKISAADHEEVMECLLNVRTELNGTSELHEGAGIPDGQQDLIGDSVWGQDDSVISYHEFRERILAEFGWEQFTGLFRFFVEYHKKLGTEVKQTREALSQLCTTLERLVDRPKTAPGPRSPRRMGA